MKNRYMPLSIAAVFAVVAGASALVWPLFRAGGEAPRTLVSTSLGMGPDQADWLAPGDPREPAAWLAERVGQGADANRMAALLGAAARRYEESPRMIANRVAQIADQVEDRREPELLADLAFDTARSRSFGAVAQHYLVLRRQGADHAAALAILRAEAGADQG